MEGIWTINAPTINQLQFIKLSDFETVQDALESLEESQEGKVIVGAQVWGLSLEVVMAMSMEEFDARRGIIIIKAKNFMEKARSICLVAERFNLYHQHALDNAKNSGWWGWATHIIMKDAEQYVDSIEEFTLRSKDQFLELWNSIQDCRSVFVHPVLEVECENPPPVDILKIDDIAEELREEMDTLYHAPLPEDSPVLCSSRKRRDDRAKRARH